MILAQQLWIVKKGFWQPKEVTILRLRRLLAVFVPFYLLGIIEKTLITT